jgi:hypothetical protein
MGLPEGLYVCSVESQKTGPIRSPLGAWSHLEDVEALKARGAELDNVGML